MTKIIKKAVNKYKKLSKPAKASFWFVICSFLQKGISFITIPIFTRIMTTDEYGLTTLFNTWSSILMIFATLNVSGSAYNRGLLQFEEKKLTSSIQFLVSIFGILVFLIVMVFNEFFIEITGLSLQILILMCCYFILISGINLWTVKERFHYRYRKLIIITLLNTILTTCFGLCAVIFSTNNKGVSKIVWTLMASIIVTIPFYFINFQKGKCFYNKDIWKYTLAFSLPLVPHYLSNLILNQSDKVMINMFYGTTFVAYYGVAQSISSIVMIFLDSINASLTPWRYQKMDSKNYSVINKISIYILFLIGLLIILINLFAPEILSIFASKEYYEAIWVIPPIMLSVYFIFLYGLFSNIEFYFLKTNFMMIASVISAVLNIILNYICIQIFGYIACAYTTLFCYMIYCVFHFLYMKKICDNQIDRIKIYDIKLIVLISFFVCLITFLSALLYKLKTVRYTILLLVILISVIKSNKIIKVLKGAKLNEI